MSCYRGNRVNHREYFENTKGTGILATADSEGRVNAALYGRPHVMEDGSFAFIMADRLTHANLQSNPRAAYLFIEAGEPYRGKRFHMTKVREETDTETIDALRRSSHGRESEKDERNSKFLVYFMIDGEMPLVGSGT